MKERLNGVLRSHVALQVQVLSTMDQRRYDAAAITLIRHELEETLDQMPAIFQKSIGDVLKRQKFAELGFQVGMNPFGVIEQGTDFVT